MKRFSLAPAKGRHASAAQGPIRPRRRKGWTYLTDPLTGKKKLLLVKEGGPKTAGEKERKKTRYERGRKSAEEERGEDTQKKGGKREESQHGNRHHFQVSN